MLEPKEIEVLERLRNDILDMIPYFEFQPDTWRMRFENDECNKKQFEKIEFYLSFAIDSLLNALEQIDGLLTQDINKKNDKNF